MACSSSAASGQADAAARKVLWLDPTNEQWRNPAPPISHVRFETTKGTFVLELIREWGPLGADRLYNLARLGYYDDTRFHRVNKNYIVQFGLHGDSAVNAVWQDRYLQDDPPRSNNVRGTFAFSFKAIPNRRNTQIYINLADNIRNNAEAFTVLGTVVEGMSVLDSLYSGYGENSGSGVRQGRQGPLANGGNAYVDREFPLLDRIRRVTVSEVKTRPAVAPAAVDTNALQRMLVAEDARGLGPDGIAPLIDGLAATSDPRIRLAAVRGLGRLQRAAVTPKLVTLLEDASPVIRSEAANAVAESMQSVWGTTNARGTDAPDSLKNAVRSAAEGLTRRIERETDPRVLGALARAVGRLPYADSASARAAERTILRGAERARGFEGAAGRAAYDVANGLYILARARRSLGDLTSPSTDLLRALSRAPAALDARRSALLALGAAGVLDTAVANAASRDADWQVRRLALTMVRALDTDARADLIRRALHDSVAMVRADAMRLVRTNGGSLPDCAPLVAATRDQSPLVELAAIDALAGPCADRAARDAALHAIAATLPAGDASREAGHVSWHAAAHAIVALARTDSSAARSLLPRFAAHPRQHVRAYAARAAAILGDASLLTRLAADANHNVQEAAVGGLQQLRAHAADSVYIAVLASHGHQAVLAAARALEGTTNARAKAALFEAFDRLSAERRENSRDPRMAILARLTELGGASDAPRLERYLADFDSSVAIAAARATTRWTGGVVRARPAPLPIRPEPLARTFLAGDVRLRVTMATGGTFTIGLDVLESPASVARVVRLARAGYYNGLTWHRMVPNFVIQGGSPDENEYVGDAAFMRDEIDARPHHRGTVGISTRGHDTGDAQPFVNLVDNPRLEHSSPLFGTVVSGMNVVDDILEGDVIRRIEVVGGPA
ncbi:MAG TPA: peptidylprolyl isomerase [Gemmatimonadaceae bacterium]|nr:peptidylprolyl isomerase [Gemmatimonadaceae bacterium]